MHFMRTLLLFFLTVIIMIPISVMADNESSSSKENKTAKRVGDEQSAYKVYQMPGITVTATKTQTPIESMPVTAYSVGREEIESQPEYGRDNYGELIKDLPGVHVAQSALTAPPWINLRGTGYFVGRTLYLIDGMPVASSTTPMLTTAINNNDIERIDVVLGPSSALYGANASGGVVNIITRRGETDTGAKAVVSYGSQNTFRPNTTIGNRNGNFHYYLSYSGDYSDGFKNIPASGMVELYRLGKKGELSSATLEDANYDNTYFSGKIGWESKTGAGIWVGYNYAQIYITGGQTNMISLDNGREGVGQFRFYTPIGDLMKVTFSLGHQFWDRPSKQNSGLTYTVNTNRLVLNATERYSNESIIERVPAELQTDFYLGKNNILTLGAFYSTERLKTENNNWRTGAPLSCSVYNTDQFALYAQDQMFFFDNRLSVLFGMRYDRWEYHDIYDSSSTPQRPDGFSKDIITYRGGAKYKFNDIFSLKSSAGTAFWPGSAVWFFTNTNTGTNRSEANPGLKPEKTWMADLGLEVSLKRTDTFFSITPYYGEITDMIAYRYDNHPTLAGVTIRRTSNISDVQIYGVELLLNQKITDHLSFVGSLTFNHSEVVRDPVNEGNQVSNSPEYFGSASIRYMNPSLVNGTVTLRLSHGRYYNNDNERLPYYYMKPYEVLDLKFWRDWEIAEKTFLTTAVSVDNLFDREYETEYYTVSPGRMIMGTLGIKRLF
ncbi:MAG TPA: TonB-dependent receptor [Syntrophorhabdaceae bacterium]|nr:TonB-dependent receptor [Syntrophorhabdaceae bacterium]